MWKPKLLQVLDGGESVQAESFRKIKPDRPADEGEVVDQLLQLSPDEGKFVPSIPVPVQARPVGTRTPVAVRSIGTSRLPSVKSGHDVATRLPVERT